jgi:uncharacterized membrane protein
VTRKLLIIELLLIAVAAAVTVILYTHLPAHVPTHRWVLLVGPGYMVAITALTAAIPWLSPRHFEVDTFRSTYRFIMAAAFLMCTYCCAVTLWAVVSPGFDRGRALNGGICLCIAVIGNRMGKVRRNFFIGVRTPWTLANERVWSATHRFAAKCFVAAGLAGLVLAIAGIHRPANFVILVGGLAPVIYSLVYYKRLERCGEL